MELSNRNPEKIFHPETSVKLKITQMFSDTGF